MAEIGRWAGRNPGKDVVRNQVWQTLETTGVAVGPAWSMIPNFVGADMAAWLLAQTDEWKRARTVKTNPDAPQIPIRLRALYEGKTVYAPVPYLTKDFPYLRIEPEKMKAKGISFELAATSQGFVEHGDRIGFEDVEHLDFCVVGSVAVSRVGGRTGKGAGFADLETAIFRELNIVTDKTPVVTTVHSSQLVDDAAVVIEAHDSPLDMVATEKELIRTGNTQRRPGGVDWERVRPDQFETIPFLAELRDRMLAREEFRLMLINDPATVREVEEVFARYEAALLGHDIAALDEMFLQRVDTVRYGVGENLYGIDEIRAYRKTTTQFTRQLERTVIVTYGTEFATASTLFHRPDAPGEIGRQMQTWVKLDGSWRVAAAHVSMIERPA